MFRATIWRAVFLLYAAAAPAVQAAPLPPDRQWDEGDIQREERLLRENVAVGVERLTLAQAYLEELLNTLEDMAPEHRGSAVRAVRQRLAHAQEAIAESTGHARWLAKQRAQAPDPDGWGRYLNIRIAVPLTRLAQQELPLIEQTLWEFEQELGAKPLRRTVGFLALDALASLTPQVAEVERRLWLKEDLERILPKLREDQRAGRPVMLLTERMLDPFGNR